MKKILLSIPFLFTFTIAIFAHPGASIVVDNSGQVFFTDAFAGVWKIDHHGKLSLIFNEGYHWMDIDVDGRFAGTQPNPFRRITPAGTTPALIVSSGRPIAIGGDGNLYYAPERRGSKLDIIRQTPEGKQSAIAHISAAEDGSPLRWLNGIAAAPDGSTYFTENASIHKISAKGVVSKVAGPLRLSECTPIPGVGEHLRPYLRGLAVGPDGTVYVAATGCGALLRVAPDGGVTTLLKTDSPWSPTGVALHGSDIYVLEYLHTASDNRREWLPRIRKISPGNRNTIIGAVQR